MILPIPAIDLIDGKCVRLTKGDYATEKVYNEDPLEVAKAFEDLGFPRLHLVDLDGARSKHVVNHHVLDRIANHTNLTIDFGGGIKQDEDLRKAFDHGAAMVTLGSIAATSKDRVLAWAAQYGSEHFIIGADVQDEKIRINGWQEEVPLMLMDFIAGYHAEGLKKVLCTDISHDGTLTGPSTALYQKVMQTFPDCGLIASGGVSGIDDLHALDAVGVPEVVFGKAIYEGKIDLKEVSARFIQNQ